MTHPVYDDTPNKTMSYIWGKYSKKEIMEICKYDIINNITFKASDIRTEVASNGGVTNSGIACIQKIKLCKNIIGEKYTDKYIAGLIDITHQDLIAELKRVYENAYPKLIKEAQILVNIEKENKRITQEKVNKVIPFGIPEDIERHIYSFMSKTPPINKTKEIPNPNDPELHSYNYEYEVGKSYFMLNSRVGHQYMPSGTDARMFGEIITILKKTRCFYTYTKQGYSLMYGAYYSDPVTIKSKRVDWSCQYHNTWTCTPRGSYEGEDLLRYKGLENMASKWIMYVHNKKDPDPLVEF